MSLVARELRLSSFGTGKDPEIHRSRSMPYTTSQKGCAQVELQTTPCCINRAVSLSKDKLRLADQLTAQNIFETQRPWRRLTRSAISSSSIAAATASASMSESVPVRRASSVARRSLRAWSRRESIVSRSRVANLVTASVPGGSQKYFFNGTSSQFAGICHPSRFQIDQQPSQVEP